MEAREINKTETERDKETVKKTKRGRERRKREKKTQNVILPRTVPDLAITNIFRLLSAIRPDGIQQQFIPLEKLHRTS